MTASIVRRMLLAAAFLAAGERATAQGVPGNVTPEMLAQGKSIYEGKAGGALCVTCHGPKAKGIQGLGPDLTDAKWLHGDGTPAFLQGIIRTGVTRPKAGVLTMPPMGGATLDDAQLRALAAYILSLNAKG